MDLNIIGGILWLFLPIITIYYRKFLYNKYPILFYIFVLISLLLIPWFIMMIFIFKGRLYTQRKNIKDNNR
jgi:hypothetical protein